MTKNAIRTAIAVITLSATAFAAKAQTIIVNEFNTQQRTNSIRQIYYFPEPGTETTIDLSYPPNPASDRAQSIPISRTGPFTQIVLPSTLPNIHTLNLTGNNLTNLTIPPRMHRLKFIIVNGNRNLAKIKFQQDTAIKSDALPEIAVGDVKQLQINAPKRLDGLIRIINYDELPTGNFRPDKLEIVRWPRSLYLPPYFGLCYNGEGQLQITVGANLNNKWINFWQPYDWQWDPNDTSRLPPLFPDKAKYRGNEAFFRVLK